MKTYSEMLPHIESRDYEINLWNALRGRNSRQEVLTSGLDLSTSALTLSPAAQEKYMAALKKESLFRNLATEIRAYDTSYRIKTAQNEDVSAWVPEGGTVTVSNGMSDFGEIALDRHKLVTSFMLENSFVQDNTFMIDKHLVSRLAQNFGRAEDDAFINGTGEHMPTGILAEEGGADVGITTAALTYDDVVKLFFSVKPRYRRNAVWLMNDETAYALRTLKDDSGNYIWNHANDTILGHKVFISEFMPNAESGSKPIFIDEVQHNDFITPELLKYIRDSKFVVVDLTHKNNGAYFEEGYAMGLGKTVIQLCKKDTQLHFDIAQKNTIMWADEEDIPSKLTNRIKATID